MDPNCDACKGPNKTRQEAISLARTYIGTPYVLGGKVRGAGVDCATLLLLYLLDIGAVCPEKLGNIGLYRPDWFCNTPGQPYLAAMLRVSRRVAESAAGLVTDATPGNLALFRVANSKVFNHGAIVTRWPLGIHAEQKGVREVDLASHWLTGQRPVDIFDPWRGKA